MQNLITDAQFAERLAELKGKRFPLLSHGGVTLIDAMGSDARIVQAARTTSNVQALGKLSDRGLIRTLIRNRHSTPIEFPVVCFLVECPMDLWRQWIRHRTASVNEFSTRYSEVPDINDTTPPDRWRLQSKSNRQGSSGEFVTEFPPDWQYPAYLHDDMKLTNPGEYLSRRERSIHEVVHELYEERIKLGVAKEQARKDLCLSTYTRAWWQNDLHNTLHFLGLRMDSHAQWEIRQFANKMGEIIQQLFPVTWEAFEDYRLNAMTLSALDKVVIANLVKRAGDAAGETAATTGFENDREALNYLPPYSVDVFMECQHPDWIELEKCTERDECLAKLRDIGLVKPLAV